MNPAEAIRETLRADLKAAMLGKNRERAALIRTLIAAIDNAEAVEATAQQQTESFRKLGDPSSEVARRVLSPEDVMTVLEGEAANRREVAAQYRAGGNETQAELLEAEARAVDGYLSHGHLG
jgi:uncharacterized protein YqeY